MPQEFKKISKVAIAAVVATGAIFGATEIVSDYKDNVTYEFADETAITFDNGDAATAKTEEIETIVDGKGIAIFGDKLTAQERKFAKAGFKNVKFFDTEAEYLAYRDPKLADREAWSINEFYEKSREQVAIYEYEIKKNNLKFTLEEIRGMRGTDIRAKMESKIKGEIIAEREK